MANLHLLLVLKITLAKTLDTREPESAKNYGNDPNDPGSRYLDILD